MVEAARHAALQDPAKFTSVSGIPTYCAASILNDNVAELKFLVLFRTENI